MPTAANVLIHNLPGPAARGPAAGEEEDAESRSTRESDERMEPPSPRTREEKAVKNNDDERARRTTQNSGLDGERGSPFASCNDGPSGQGLGVGDGDATGGLTRRRSRRVNASSEKRKKIDEFLFARVHQKSIDESAVVSKNDHGPTAAESGSGHRRGSDNSEVAAAAANEKGKRAMKFGSTLPRTTDLEESIETQPNQLCIDQLEREMFRAPVALRDPHGGDRPAARSGPTEARRGPVPGAPGAGRTNAGGGDGAGASIARSDARPDRPGIRVFPPERAPRHDVAGNACAGEVLRRARAESRRLVREAAGRGEEVLRVVYEDVCHICHNRRETGLLFHCQIHAYCDTHCASRLSIRAHDYDSRSPTNIPLDYCPVCTLHCTCAKCARRLEDVSKKMEIQCQRQNCGVGDVVMDNLYDLCSAKVNKKSEPKKVRTEVDGLAVQRTAVAAAKKKRGPSGGEDPPYISRQSNGRFARASSSTEDAEGNGARPRKKVKVAETIAPVPVLKVPPSDFPREMHGTEDLDPSSPEDLNRVFVPDGSCPADSSADSSKQKFQEAREAKAAEGNFFRCAACDRSDGGELICCERCPRACHEKCLEEQATPGEQRRECKWCEWDGLVRPEEDIFSCDMKLDEQIRNAYRRYQGASGYTYVCIMIGELLQVLEKLKCYDYGEIFAAPVDTKMIPDYINTISKPMDYGTIVSNLKKGRYSPSSSDAPASSDNGESDMDEMENIVLKALLDIEQVHHNCLLYNARGTPYHRAGEVQARKWRAYFAKHIDERLPGNVRRGLALFREARAAERLAYGRGRKFQVPSSTPTVRSKALAVFDPDARRIVKQYNSKTAARTAVVMLYEAGYACEWVLSQTSAKFRLDNAEDPSKPLFGYQWVPTEKLKRGDFKVKPSFRNDDLVSPTPNNLVMLNEDTVSGVKSGGVASEESADQDREIEKLRSFNAGMGQKEDDAGSSNAESGSAEFVRNYVDGDKSTNGIIWNRADQPDNGADNDVATMMSKSSIRNVVVEKEHAATSPTKEGKSEEHPSE